MPSSFLSFFFILSSFLPFLFYSLFLPSFFFLISTSETIKPVSVKRQELDPKMVHPNNRDCGYQLGRVGQSQTLTQSVPGLVEECGCVRGQALAWSGRLAIGIIFHKEKEKKEALSGCLGNSPAAATLPPVPLPPTCCMFTP